MKKFEEEAPDEAKVEVKMIDAIGETYDKIVDFSTSKRFSDTKKTLYDL